MISKEEFFTIVIPTFNRFNELVISLPQFLKLVSNNSEIIVIDQSNDGLPQDNILFLKSMCSGANVRYYLSEKPSLPLSINTGAHLAKNDIVFILDDDLDIIDDIIIKHLPYYSDLSVSAVAGSYYAGNYSSPWVPTEISGRAKTLASAHMSARKEVLLSIGAATWLKKPFTTIDWELAESINKFGKVVVAKDCFVFHRAPSVGGCENQGFRSVEWYKNTIHNHYLWLRNRRFPLSLLKLPKHIFTIIKYNIPGLSSLISFDFWKDVIMPAVKSGRNTYKKYNKIRPSEIFEDREIKLLFETKKFD
ncbi:MAG: glycosyltransferase [Alishewanella agri]|nr:glycosyltransferase [Alishewanella agri]